MHPLHVLAAGVAFLVLAADTTQPALNVLPARGTTHLSQNLEAAKRHARHTWRDVPPWNEDGTVNAYVEIPRGDRRKWEFDMSTNTRTVDRVMPKRVGGYPVNYGFVPQTVSYDGDPFDALVLGPPLPGGQLIRGVAVGVMHMEDEKGYDAKVVLSLTGSDGRPLHPLSAEDEGRIGEYFRRYKRHEPGAFSKVPGWGGLDQGLALVKTTHAFFLQCREHTGRSCQVAP